VTKGGFKDDAWVEIADVPGGRLAAKWRYLLCQRLRQRRPTDAALQRVTPAPPCTPTPLGVGAGVRVAQTYSDHRGFQVHTDTQRVYPRGLEAAHAERIGRYLGHAARPLATSHLTDYDGQRVTYWYIDTATGMKQTVTGSAFDFISRLVVHIPPKGMQMVRYAGLYARSIKRRCAELAHIALEVLRTQLPLFALEPLRKVCPIPSGASALNPASAMIRSRVLVAARLCSSPKFGNPNGVRSG
jgi:hypothetical protein